MQRLNKRPTITNTMQSLDDAERRQILGEVLFDEFRVIREYLQDIPVIKKKIYTIDERLIEVERIVRAHEVDIRHILQVLSNYSEFIK